MVGVSAHWQNILAALVMGFAVGVFWTWPIAHRRGFLKDRRSHHFDDDESGAWDV